MTTNEAEHEPGPPLQEEDFASLLKEYKVGLKGEYYNTIAKHISRMGGSTIYEEPEALARVLTDFSQEIDPVKRKLILARWFSEKNIAIPEETLRKVGMSQVERKAEEIKEGKEKEPEKYSVDDETGSIKVASTADKTALTWAEAEKLSKEIKKSIEGKRKVEGKSEEEAKESPFIVNDKGDWQLNPKAKISGMELLAFEAVKKSREKGETADPFEILAAQAKSIETMRSVFGGGKEGGGFLDSVDDLIKLKTLLGTDEDSKTLLSGIYKRLTESGEGKGESEDVKGLREDVKSLREELERKERERVEERITSLNTTISDVRADLARVRSESRATDEYGIMGEAIKVVDRRLGALEGMARGIFGKAPGLLPSGVKRELTQAISEEAVEAQALDELAEKVFYS